MKTATVYFVLLCSLATFGKHVAAEDVAQQNAGEQQSLSASGDTDITHHTQVPASYEPGGNRLTYLAEPCDPFYVNGAFPRLVTPQWVGQEGVEAVVVLSIDDMRDPAHYERFLRPILNRLKKLDGRAPLSILTNSVDPNHAQLQSWLQEGLSLEVHTIDHPCPCLGGGNFEAARSTYDRCVDLMASIPGNQPVAYRMPCCDSINSTSPRFWSEIFNQTTAKGNFLQVDSSVFHIFTPRDETLRGDLVKRDDGKPRFRHYLPFPSFVNTIEDYPYPYVIGRLCWEIPCIVPSDWEGQHVQRPNNPQTLEDMQRALDATVLKQGATSLVFHPHGWIRSEQVVGFIDHAVEKHDRRVMFLSFRECLDRFNRHMLGGEPLRAANGQDNGVRLLDLNNDGYLDVVIGNERVRRTRVWLPEKNEWQESSFPVQIVHVDETGISHTAGVQFFVTRDDGHASLLVRNGREAGVWHFIDGRWAEDESMLAGLEVDGQPIFTAKGNRDLGVRLRDLDGDGRCELIAGGGKSRVFRWEAQAKSWQLLPFGLPPNTSIVDDEGKDAGLRFVDINGDGHDDVIFSDQRRFSLHLFSSLEKGWDLEAQSGTRPEQHGIPPIVRNGTNNGAWFAQNHLWVQNEDTQRLPDLVDRRSFANLLSDEAKQPRSPEASRRAIEVRAGMRVELVAAEPLVMDPVAFDWGTDGRLWVVEMADYPLGLDDKGKPGGRVRFLEDTDNDGKYDKSTLFADDIAFPTDVMTWRKGVLVTAAPNLWYLEDTNHDGKADRKEVWFTGFGEGNQQHRVNGLRWGLDNWVYLANGDSGGRIHSVKTGMTVDINGRDLRIRPDTGASEAATGQTQHGRNRDDWGNWWGANNSVPMIQFVLDDHYLRRNPHVAPPDPRFITSEQNWDLFPISRILSHYSGYQPPPPGQPSRFTSACGTIVYRDTLLGEELYGSMFVSEPVHNLVHRRLVEHDGVTMVPRKPADEEGREFLRSRDSWFRPTTLRTGPDGCLWIADMYRLVIEHPEWIADDVEKTLDLRAGHDKGRIYRIVREDAAPRAISDFSAMSTAQLVDALANPSGTTRDLAQRMLLWRDDDSAVALLEDATASDIALQRLHAICTLDGLGAIKPEMLIAAVTDEHAGVRRHAVRIAEKFAGSESRGPIVEALVARSMKETDPHVVLQLAYSLGEFDDATAGRALGALLARNHDDRYIAAAAICGIGKRPADVAAGARDAVAKDDGAVLPIEPILGTALGTGDSSTIASLIEQLLPASDGEIAAWQLNALAGIAQSLRQQGQSFDKIMQGDDASAKRTRLWAAARRVLLDVEKPQPERSAALRLLGSDPSFGKRDVEVLVSLLAPQTPSDMQRTAIEAVGALNDMAAIKDVLGQWRSFGPLTRDRLTGILLQRNVTTTALLNALQAKTVDPADISAAHRQNLVNHRDRVIAAAAAKLLGVQIDTERQKVIDRYLPTVKAGGDAQRGLPHFLKACAQCHKVGGHGHDVGPNLDGLVDKSPEFLTTHILDPGRAVEDKYRNYLLLTVDGRQFTGLLKSETATSVTLVGQNGDSHTALKQDIDDEGFRRSKLSMMPQGLEATLDPQTLADVVAFIIDNQSPPKSFSGNAPRLVAVEERSGALRLRATDAAIYGPSLVFESKYKNLGFWSSADDRAQWIIDVPESGQYDVYLDWAAAEETAGNAFELRIGGEIIRGRVESTGTWDDYRQAKVGVLQLKRGRQQAVFHAADGLSGFLMDLREVCLVPAGQHPPPQFQADD